MLTNFKLYPSLHNHTRSRPLTFHSWGRRFRLTECDPSLSLPVLKTVPFVSKLGCGVRPFVHFTIGSRVNGDDNKLISWTQAATIFGQMH